MQTIEGPLGERSFAMRPW